MWAQNDQDNTFWFVMRSPLTLLESRIFCSPVIPQGSKEILEKHQRRQEKGKKSKNKEEISSSVSRLATSSGSTSSLSGKRDQKSKDEKIQKKLPVGQTDLDEYLSLPVTER